MSAGRDDHRRLYDKRLLLGMNRSLECNKEAAEELQAHIFDGERCRFCYVNVYDNMLDPHECVRERGGLVYTSEKHV